MAYVQFTDLQSRPTEFLDFTSVTLDEFQQLVPPFEAAFQAHMAAWRLDGKPRTAHRFSVYQNCPFPTPEDRLLFILAYVKTYSLQVVQGRLFGMGQSQSVDSRALARAAGRAAHPRRCPGPLPDGPGPAARRLGGGGRHRGHPARGGSST
jgi:hypothetical protein